MNLETLRNYCQSFPCVSEDIKWKDNLCFMVAGKIFCITGFDSPLIVSIKVRDEEFEELSSTEGILPAPYLARYKWVLVINPNTFSEKQWEYYISQSYELVKAKIPQKIIDQAAKPLDSKKTK